MMRKVMIVAVLAAFMAGGCSQGKAKELWETAQFEEKQHNLEHARKLYEELAAKYAKTEEGEKARKRLQELQQPAK